MDFMMEAMDSGFSVLYGISTLFSSAFGILLYVLKALSLYTIAKRRGINHPWMSWVPVLDLWVLGCISDQYRYVVKGEIRNKRKTLLILNIIIAVLCLAVIVLAVVLTVHLAGGLIRGNAGMVMEETVLVPAVVLLCLTLPLAGVGIAVTVVRYIAMYDLYTSCTPQNNVVFLVLSIFFSVTEPFFLLMIRNKDEGMPPRRREPQYVPPQSQYEPPQEEL